MSTIVPLLAREQIDRLPERAREVVEYRKSGLSLNHSQGCPLDCAYCIRHTYGLWDQRRPRALMTDAQAVEELVSHRYFQAHMTPIQLFNRATDPFLPNVRPNTFAVLADLDARGLRNHVLVITRHQTKPEDVQRLNRLPEPYEDTARRKIVPETLEQRVLATFSDSTSLFRKTSCAVSYAHGLPDYNGHIGIRELCDICPLTQLGLCLRAHRVPTADQLREVARVLPEASGLQVVDITEQAAVVAGLAEEQPRYYLQHALRFQVHDERHPHHTHRHGRADIGWKEVRTT